MHPEVLLALNDAHIADLRVARHGGPSGRRSRSRPYGPSPRERAGWLLVELGLRMATPRAGTGAPPPVTPG